MAMCREDSDGPAATVRSCWLAVNLNIQGWSALLAGGVNNPLLYAPSETSGRSDLPALFEQWTGVRAPCPCHACRFRISDVECAGPDVIRHLAGRLDCGETASIRCDVVPWRRARIARTSVSDSSLRADHSRRRVRGRFCRLSALFKGKSCSFMSCFSQRTRVAPVPGARLQRAGYIVRLWAGRGGAGTSPPDAESDGRNR
jgi:hypothetical protein